MSVDETVLKAKFPIEIEKEMRADARRFDARNPGSYPERFRYFDRDPNFDSAEGIFLARQLEFIRKGLYEIPYPELKSKRLLPWNTDVNTGAEQYTARAVDHVGDVKVTKMLAGNVPMAKFRISETSTSIFSMVEGYEYTIQDARAAIYAGVPLSTKLATAVRNDMERKLDEIAFVGDTSLVSSATGLLNQSGTLTYSTPTTGTGASASWDAKSPDQILLDLNAPLDQVVTNSDEIESCDTLLLPTSRFRLVNRVRVGDGTSTSILAYFNANQKRDLPVSVESTFRAETAGSGSSKRACAYRNSSDKLEMILSQPFEQMQPVAMHFSVATMCHMRTAGLALYVPGSVIYMDNI